MCTLGERERIDYVNDDLKLIQKPDGLTFGTDALLLAGYVNERSAKGAELGAGSGIISMLLLSRNKLQHSTALEVQPEYASLTRRNAELNGLTDRLLTVEGDLRDHKADAGCYDTVFTNPPYMTTDSGRENAYEAKNVARHEVKGDIFDFLACAGRLLRYGGSFYAVYRTDRLADLISAMRANRIEPKRITAVHADLDSVPSMVLTEGRLGGGKGLFYTPPLIIYGDKSHSEYSDDMKYIDTYGVFPEKFTRR
jgi:tRNA1Val (adenine37-N6)-methyltransferase